MMEESEYLITFIVITSSLPLFFFHDCEFILFSHLGLQCDACKCVLHNANDFHSRFSVVRASILFSTTIVKMWFLFTVICIKNDNCFLFFPIFSCSFFPFYFAIIESDSERESASHTNQSIQQPKKKCYDYNHEICDFESYSSSNVIMIMSRPERMTFLFLFVSSFDYDFIFRHSLGAQCQHSFHFYVYVYPTHIYQVELNKFESKLIST